MSKTLTYKQKTALFAAALVFASCSNEIVPDLPPPCGEGAGYYDIETHYCFEEVRQICTEENGCVSIGGQSCAITSAEEEGHTYEVICKGKHIGYLDNGKPGEKGELGLEGTNGQNCSIDSISLGVKITCATVELSLNPNGKDGENGAPGENCDIAQTDEGIAITCDGIEFLPLNRGATGATGETGEPGEPGATGAAGTNCTIVENPSVGVAISCNGVTLSISGATGATGGIGLAGQDCEIVPILEDFEITCGTVTPLQLSHGTNGTSGSVITIVGGYWHINGVSTNMRATGADGAPGVHGESCEVKDKTGDSAYLVMTCGDGANVTTVEWPKAMCMMTAYDPETHFCYENITAPLCGGQAYSLATQFCDSRDNKIYKKTKIGNQTWMAENLNYDTNTSGSACYSNEGSYCDIYGRLYNWNTAMTACPSGWHLPSNEDWSALETTVGGSSTAGNHLKATSGWYSDGNGQDTYGFAAIPGGCDNYLGDSFIDAGLYGYWWGASEHMGIGYYYGNAYWSSISDNDKDALFSVRCVQD